MGVVFFFAGEPLLRIFTDDAEVLRVGTPSLQVIGLASPLWSVAITLSGSLRGAGDTRFPMWITLITGWLIRVPFSVLAGLTIEERVTHSPRVSGSTESDCAWATIGRADGSSIAASPSATTARDRPRIT